MTGPVRLAIVGAGPRCTYVLERLAGLVSASRDPVAVEIHVFERSGEFGAGAVHSTRQPATSFLNRTTGQVGFGADETVEDAGPLLDRALRPTLHEWCREQLASSGDPDFDLGPDDWPKRRVHGQALRDMFARYVDLLRQRVPVHLHEHEVVDLREHGSGFAVLTDTGAEVVADHVLLLTGHSTNHPSAEVGEWAQSAGYLPSCYPLEEHLTAELITPLTTVGCLHMGLSCLDVLLYLTEGRGGRFATLDDSSLRYHRSGREPRSIVVLSGSGLFTFARACAGTGAARPQGRFFTRAAIDRLRGGEHRKLDFESDLLPLIQREMRYRYYETLYGPSFAENAGDDIQARADEVAAVLDDVLFGARPLEESWPLDEVLSRYLTVLFGPAQAQAVIERLRNVPGTTISGLVSPWKHPLRPAEHRFDWDRLIRPIAEPDCRTPQDYRRALLEFLDRDIRWAEQGIADNPAKACAELVWSGLRSVLVYAMNHGGLTGDSHQRFLSTYMRHHNRLVDGAAAEVMARVRALVEAGVVDVSAGPQAQVRRDSQTGRLHATGPLTGADIALDVLVNAKVHLFQPEHDVRLLYANLLRRGLVRKWRNPIGDGAHFEPGGIDVTADFAAVRANGTVDQRIGVLGPPSEGAMTFQLGTLRPHDNHHIMRGILRWLHPFWAEVADRSTRQIGRGFRSRSPGR